MGGCIGDCPSTGKHISLSERSDPIEQGIKPGTKQGLLSLADGELF